MSDGQDAPSPAPPTDDDRFERAWSAIVEFFPDAFLAVKTCGGFRWRETDVNWTRGLCDCYLSRKRASDIIDIMDRRRT